jgi:glycosyltransferase involved in cell wall biosynthesis
VKTATAPRDANPYQDLLHAALLDTGVEPGYLSTPTPSQSLNVLLIPLTLLRARLGGVRVLHLHWVFALTFAGSSRWPAVRWLSQRWFTAILVWCRCIGVRVVWTAHNVLPHERVFWDDRAARATLLRSSSHVIVHDEGVSAELATLVGGADRLPPVTVVPHGSFATHYSVRGDQADARTRLGLPLDRRILLFVGRVTVEKGVEDLLRAFASLTEATVAAAAGGEGPLLVVAGRCADADLAERLTGSAVARASAARLDLRQLPDDDLSDYVAAADVVVLPFRRVTTSGSVLLALGFARPVVIPDVPQLAAIPDDACVRYSAHDVSSLRDALAVACAMPQAALRDAGEAGRSWSSAATWSSAASRTARVYRDALQHGRTT